MSSPQDRPRFSVAMIVRDEQDVLAETIASVGPIADEIVVLDTGSRDRTMEVARELGAAVYQAPWKDDFSAARNYLLNKATGAWVLWLDAGERLTGETAAKLRAFVDCDADPNKVYLLMVESPPAHPGASAEQAAQARLMPNRAELWFEGRVRETLKASVEAAGLALDMAPGRIVRHARQHDPVHKARRAQRRRELAALEQREGRPQVRVILAMGEAAADIEDRTSARRAFAEAARLARRGSTEMLDAYYGLLASLDGDSGDPARPLAVCMEALEIFPLDAQLLCAMGTYLQAQDQWELAARAFRIAMQYGQVDVETWHLREVAEVAAACLAITLQLSGRDDEALSVLEEGLYRHPDSSRLCRHLVDLHIKHAREDEAVRAAEGLFAVSVHRRVLRDAVRGACRAARKEWLPALGFLQSAYALGCRDPICLRWLAVTLLANGQGDAAGPVLREWQTREPNNAEVRAYLEALEQQEPNAVAGESGVRWLRVDPGSTVLDAFPAHIPIISQVSSAD